MERDHVTGLVREALDRFDEVPLGTSTRRAYRIARLRGNVDIAHRLQLELRPSVGVHDRVSAASALYPGLSYNELQPRHMQVVERWIESRTPRLLEGVGDDARAVLYGTVDELEVSLLRAAEAMQDAQRDQIAHLIPDGYEMLDARREVIDRVRAFVFDYLVRTETELEVSDTVAQVLARHRARVDAALSSFAPDVRDQLQAALRTAREDDKEARSQVLTTCRRVLVAVADHLYPPRDEPVIDSTGTERQVGPGQYRNRLLLACEATRTADHALRSAMVDLATRLDKLDELTHKGVHHEVSRAEMEFGLVQTYCLVGELVERQQGSTS